MEYAQIKNVNKPVARLVFGTSNPAFRRGDDVGEFLDELIGLGFTAFDTARVYAKAERTLGNYMASRGNRDKLVILTKGGHPALIIPRLNERAIKKDFSISCRELKTDYIDIYLLHRDNPRIQAGTFVEILNSLIADGKVGAIGGSNWTHRRIEEANEYAYKHNLVPFTVSSPYFGLADMKGDPFGNGAVSVAGAKHEEAREWYKTGDVAVMPYSTLGCGFFSGRVHKKSDMHGWPRRAFTAKENFERLTRAREIAEKKGCTVAQLALAWTLKHNIKPFAIMTSTSISRMKQNLDAFDVELTEEEAAYIDLH
ncbi:MAG: aldo/keto reductase [Clostridiales bacterium]|nr:aldo/keto reductase [Clostridiales bacterium]